MTTWFTIMTAMNDPRRVEAALARNLRDWRAKRGWSQARLEKLMGGNFLRVYREAWGG